MWLSGPDNSFKSDIEFRALERGVPERDQGWQAGGVKNESIYCEHQIWPSNQLFHCGSFQNDHKRDAMWHQTGKQPCGRSLYTSRQAWSWKRVSSDMLFMFSNSKLVRFFVFLLLCSPLCRPFLCQIRGGGNHSSWGNRPRATIPPRGMVRLGTNPILWDPHFGHKSNAGIHPTPRSENIGLHHKLF